MTTAHKTVLGPQFLYADDLIRDGEWAAVTVTVKDVHAPGTVKGADGQAVESWAVGFEKTDKLLVLNKTNCQVMNQAAGTADKSKWPGHKITLYPAELAACFGERDVPCIRVRLPENGRMPFRVRKHLGKELTGQPVGDRPQTTP